MTDLPRNKYEILDMIFTFFIALCMVLSAIFILSNLIVSLIFVVVVVLFAFWVLFLWISRNPFNIYLVRTFAFNNFIFTFIAIVLLYSRLSPTLTENPVRYALFLLPSGIYLLISYKWSAVINPLYKRPGAMLAMAGRHKAARNLFISDNKEERLKREELIAKQKKEYRYKLLIALAITLTLSSLLALIFGFY